MNTKQYSKIIRNKFDYKRYCKLIGVLGPSLNSRKDRFDKSDIIEQSFADYTHNGSIQWVDSIGQDHYDSDYGLTLEMKFLSSAIFTKVKKTKRKNFTAKIKNSLGKNKGNNIDKLCDFYVFAEESAMSIMSGEDLKPFLKSISDGIEATIPVDKVEIIFSPDDVKDININETSCINYKKEKNAMQKRMIANVKI